MNKELIKIDIQKIQNILDGLDNDTAIKISIFGPTSITINHPEVEYWWNENSFLRSALEQELRNLKLELLNT